MRESVAVTCRPITSFRWPRNVEMMVGDHPRPVVVQAVFASGEEEVMRPISLTTRNEDIARLRGDSVVAVAPGSTILDVELGGLNVQFGVFVSALVAEGTRCLRSLRVDDTVTCVVYERGAVVVRNTGTDAESPARRAYVRIVRTP